MESSNAARNNTPRRSSQPAYIHTYINIYKHTFISIPAYAHAAYLEASVPRELEVASIALVPGVPGTTFLHLLLQEVTSRDHLRPASQLGRRTQRMINQSMILASSSYYYYYYCYYYDTSIQHLLQAISGKGLGLFLLLLCSESKREETSNEAAERKK